MCQLVELDTLHAALVDDGEELVLEVGAAAIDLIEEDRLGVPDGGRGAQVLETALAIGHGVADEIVVVEQAGVVVAPGEAECIGHAGQQQALAGAVGADEQHRQLGCGGRHDDGLDVIEADEAEAFEQVRLLAPRAGGWHDTYSHPAWESHRAPGVSPGPVAVPSSGQAPPALLMGSPSGRQARLGAGVRFRTLPHRHTALAPLRPRVGALVAAPSSSCVSPALSMRVAHTFVRREHHIRAVVPAWVARPLGGVYVVTWRTRFTPLLVRELEPSEEWLLVVRVVDVVATGPAGPAVSLDRVVEHVSREEGRA